MFDAELPPLAGVLAPQEERLLFERWQKVLAGLSQPEGLLAMADGLASIPQGLAPFERRELVLLLVVLLVNQAQGSSYLPLGDRAWLKELLDPFGAVLGDWEALLRDRAQCLVQGPGAPLGLEKDRLYSGRLLSLEVQLAARARRRSEWPSSGRGVVRQVLEAPDPLVEEQQRAVTEAVAGSLTLVTGGPGTGKTSIVVAMLRSLVRGEAPLRPQDILLAAPTGKAAQRMGHSIRKTLQKLAARQPLEAPDQSLEGLEPQTLHLLLGWDPHSAGFRHHAANRLAARAVIVDEASMIDLGLMNALFAAVPEDAILVLLGDADQLPSVAAGQAFRDLLTALPERQQLLKESHRMKESQILAAALAINRGDSPAFSTWDHFQDLVGSGVEVLAPTSENLNAFCADWARKHHGTVTSEDGATATSLGSVAFAPLVHRGGAAPFDPADLARVKRVVAHYDEARVLCPVNLGADLRSVASLNDFFHQQAVARAMEHGGLEQAVARVAGEPVMVRHNDYRRGIFNGDQGVVMLVQKDAAIHREVFFPRGEGFLHFPLAAIQEELDLCYAMTVHKAQGSEFAKIALILPEWASPLLTREILYTALTRAKEVVTILGTQAVLETSIRKPVVRWSGLAQRIQAAAVPNP